MAFFSFFFFFFLINLTVICARSDLLLRAINEVFGRLQNVAAVQQYSNNSEKEKFKLDTGLAALVRMVSSRLCNLLCEIMLADGSQTVTNVSSSKQTQYDRLDYTSID